MNQVTVMKAAQEGCVLTRRGAALAYCEQTVEFPAPEILCCFPLHHSETVRDWFSPEEDDKVICFEVQ